MAKLQELIKDTMENNFKENRKFKHLREYLLWVLMFMKLYTSKNNLASTRVPVDEKYL